MFVAYLKVSFPFLSGEHIFIHGLFFNSAGPYLSELLKSDKKINEIPWRHFDFVSKNANKNRRSLDVVCSHVMVDEVGEEAASTGVGGPGPQLVTRPLLTAGDDGSQGPGLVQVRSLQLKTNLPQRLHVLVCQPCGFCIWKELLEYR